MSVSVANETENLPTLKSAKTKKVFPLGTGNE